MYNQQGFKKIRYILIQDSCQYLLLLNCDIIL
jgi:hypothetical protein